MDSFQDDPQYKGMKYLVFGTILSSLLSELQIIIPKTDRNGLCIGMGTSLRAAAQPPRDAVARALDHLREGRRWPQLVPGLSVGTSLRAAQRSSLLVVPPPSGVCLRAVEVLGEVASA